MGMRGVTGLMLPGRQPARPTASPQPPGIYVVRGCDAALPTGEHRIAPAARLGMDTGSWGRFPLAGPKQFRQDVTHVLSELSRGQGGATGR